MDAFDADVLIYAAVPDHTLGRRIRALFSDEAPGDMMTPAGVGSMLLLPELLTKPTRDQADEEVVALAALLARLDLRPLDEATAELARYVARNGPMTPRSSTGTSQTTAPSKRCPLCPAATKLAESGRGSSSTRRTRSSR